MKIYGFFIKKSFLKYLIFKSIFQEFKPKTRYRFN